MRSFSYNKEVIVPITNRFTPHTDAGRYWLSDYYVKAVTDGLDGNANPDRWGAVCEKYTNLNKVRREVPIISEGELESEAGFKGVVEGISTELAVYSDYDKLEDNSYFKLKLDEFLEMREYVLLEDGIDLGHALLQGLRGHRGSLANIIKVKDKYVGLSELIQDVCSHKDFGVYLENAIMSA